MQFAAVDTSVPSRGQLVIWLSNPESSRIELFDRLASYGCHAIKPHYANQWFGLVPPEVRNDGVSLGQIRLEAAIGGGERACSMALRSPRNAPQIRAAVRVFATALLTADGLLTAVGCCWLGHQTHRLRLGFPPASRI